MSFIFEISGFYVKYKSVTFLNENSQFVEELVHFLLSNITTDVHILK